MIGVDFIPSSVRNARKCRAHIRRWVVAIAVTGSAVAVPLIVDAYREAQAAELSVQEHELHERMTTLRADLDTMTVQAKNAQLQVQRAQALRAKRAWSRIFAMLAEQMPDRCWLASVSTDPVAPPQSGPVAAPQTVRAVTDGRGPAEAAPPAALVIEAPRKLRISGFATNAAEPHAFVRNLKGTGVFASVILERSRREPVLDGYYFRFELACTW